MSNSASYQSARRNKFAAIFLRERERGRLFNELNCRALWQSGEREDEAFNNPLPDAAEQHSFLDKVNGRPAPSPERSQTISPRVLLRQGGNKRSQDAPSCPGFYCCEDCDPRALSLSLSLSFTLCPLKKKKKIFADNNKGRKKKEKVCNVCKSVVLFFYNCPSNVHSATPIHTAPLHQTPICPLWPTSDVRQKKRSLTAAKIGHVFQPPSAPP